MTGCFSQFAKTLIGLVNGIIFLAGMLIVFLAYDKWTRKFERYVELFETQTTFKILFWVAAFLAISTFLGFTLLCCNVKLFQYIYAASVLVVLLLEIGIFIFKVSSQDLLDEAGKFWKTGWVENSTAPGEYIFKESAIKNFVNYLEPHYNCCYYEGTLPVKYLERCQSLNVRVDVRCKAQVEEQINDFDGDRRASCRERVSDPV